MNVCSTKVAVTGRQSSDSKHRGAYPAVPRQLIRWQGPFQVGYCGPLKLKVSLSVAASQLVALPISQLCNPVLDRWQQAPSRRSKWCMSLHKADPASALRPVPLWPCFMLSIAAGFAWLFQAACSFPSLCVHACEPVQSCVAHMCLPCTSSHATYK